MRNDSKNWQNHFDVVDILSKDILKRKNVYMKNSQTILQFRIIAYAQYLNIFGMKKRMSNVKHEIVSGEVTKN